MEDFVLIYKNNENIQILNSRFFYNAVYAAIFDQIDY